ncbi:hypothetical protein DWV76_15130 [Segatella copri]|uniref:Uncharacterized protein n=1 Tax=Segatella copri TaxID=165179 RepID=A0AA92TVE5_9BACT|nr:hypothetical protein DWV76_15130 [Segatella copri]
MAEEKLPLRPLIRELALGQTIDFPIKRMLSVKSSCTDLGAIYSRKFKTKINREKEIITVTRTK